MFIRLFLRCKIIFSPSMFLYILNSPMQSWLPQSDRKSARTLFSCICNGNLSGFFFVVAVAVVLLCFSMFISSSVSKFSKYILAPSESSLPYQNGLTVCFLFSLRNLIFNGPKIVLAKSPCNHFYYIKQKSVLGLDLYGTTLSTLGNSVLLPFSKIYSNYVFCGHLPFPSLIFTALRSPFS